MPDEDYGNFSWGPGNVSRSYRNLAGARNKRNKNGLPVKFPCRTRPLDCNASARRGRVRPALELSVPSSG